MNNKIDWTAYRKEWAALKYNFNYMDDRTRHLTFDWNTPSPRFTRNIKQTPVITFGSGITSGSFITFSQHFDPDPKDLFDIS